MGSYYEFFAGGGMARAGLGAEWRCLFANDIDLKKAASYAQNWGTDDLKVCDVAEVTTAMLPNRADLSWASFPCQDLSLAGHGAGLNGKHSGAFWPFWRLMTALAAQDRAPRLIVLENVCGALTSHEGKDFSAIGAALAAAGYQFGAVVVNAIHFVPQSRPRLFILAVHQALSVPAEVIAQVPDAQWHTKAVMRAYAQLSGLAQEHWFWWSLPSPPARNATFTSLIEEAPQGVAWHTPAQTQRLLELMSSVNLAKVEAAKQVGRRIVGTVYKRTRPDANGKRTQRAEVRFDDIAGCLRTPVGGSSRQTLMIVEGDSVRSRLLSPREAARLMGLADDYILPDNYNEAYHLAGDGLVAPVARFLAEHLIEPILAKNRSIMSREPAQRTRATFKSQHGATLPL